MHWVMYIGSEIAKSLNGIQGDLGFEYFGHQRDFYPNLHAQDLDGGYFQANCPTKKKIESANARDDI